MPTSKSAPKSSGYGGRSAPKTKAEESTIANAAWARTMGAKNNATRKAAGKVSLPKQSSDPRAATNTKAGAVKQAQAENKWKREQAVRSGREYDAARAKVRGKK